MRQGAPDRASHAESALRALAPAIGFCLLLLVGSASDARAQDRLAEEAAQGRWLFTPGRVTLGVGAGGGFSTAHGLRTASLAMLAGRVGYVIAQQDRFLPGSLEVVAEPLYLVVLEPGHETAHAFGFSALLKYNIWTGTRFVPFVEGGGGVSYASINVPKTGTNFNFMAQIGVGLHYRIGERTTLDLRGIYHHISNANISTENPSLNSAQFLLGVTFFR